MFIVGLDDTRTITLKQINTTDITLDTVNDELEKLVHCAVVWSHP